MIEIKNLSKEPVEIIQMIDPTTPGIRIVAASPPPSIIEPGQSIVMLGYEPGVWFRFRPLKDHDQPRTLLLGPSD
jgi:hypothetical protein